MLLYQETNSLLFWSCSSYIIRPIGYGYTEFEASVILIFWAPNGQIIIFSGAHKSLEYATAVASAAIETRLTRLAIFGLI
jgi:hypothetical protein